TTKSASWNAGNAWCEKKQVDIDAQKKKSPMHPRSEAIVDAMQANLGVNFSPKEESTQAFLDLMGRHVAEGQHLPDWLTEAVLGAEKLGRIRQGVDALMGSPVPSERSVGKQAEQWLTLLRLSVQQGLMDAGRFDSYARQFRLFEKWLGAESPIDVITAPKLEEWWAYLSLKVSEHAYSPAYARTIFMTSKQFICRLGELSLIPLPGNIRSRRFK